MEAVTFPIDPDFSALAYAVARAVNGKQGRIVFQSQANADIAARLVSSLFRRIKVSVETEEVEMEKYIEVRLRHIIAELKGLPSLDEKVNLLNEIKIALHEAGPFSQEPVDCVLWAKAETVTANDYNPNSVAPPEMKLLQVSIGSDGYTQPIVTFPEGDGYTVVDGFHRTRVGKECADVKARTGGYLPVTAIRTDREDRGDRIAATIRHNRARGKHKIEAMSEIVIELKRRFWSDEKIGHELGMDPDEILRLSQISGLAEMFQDQEFSEAWEATLIDESDDLAISNEIIFESSPDEISTEQFPLFQVPKEGK